MNYTDLPAEKKRDYDKRVLKGAGELIDWEYVELETVTEEVDGKKVKKEVPVNKVKQFYVGKMTLFQTTGIISVLSAVFANGQEFKVESGRTDNLAFIEYLDEYHLSLILSTILMVEREWFLTDDFDVTQALKVLAAFLKYNNFFGLLAEVQKIGESLGMSAEKARAALIGEKS